MVSLGKGDQGCRISFVCVREVGRETKATVLPAPLSFSNSL